MAIKTAIQSNNLGTKQYLTLISLSHLNESPTNLSPNLAVFLYIHVQKNLPEGP